MPNKETRGIIQELEDLATDEMSDAFILYLYLSFHVNVNK